MKISVNKELKGLIPPLSKAEYSGLEASIIKDGCRDPLVLWRKNGKCILADGHNRKRICDKHKIKYKTVIMKFKNHGECYNWIISNQLSKRNITPESRDYLIGKRYKSEKKPVGNPNQLEHNVPIGTAEKIAEEYKVTHMTIKRAEKFTDAVDNIISQFPTKRQNEVKGLLLRRHYGLSKKDIIDLSSFSSKLIREVVDETKEFWQARSEHNKKTKAKRLKRAAKLSMPSDIKLYVGDALKLSDKHLKDESIDCICTDLPYSKDALECYEKLGQIAQRVLKPSGFCCFYSGKMFLAEVMSIMSKYLDYYWQIALLHHGNMTTVFNPQACHKTRINEFYKPILIFQKPPNKKQNEYCDDVIQGSGAEKSLHPWQQSERELHSIVDKFSDIGSTILDPFNGSGTSGVIAKKLGRKYIGFDVDADCIKESKIRIRNVVNAQTATKAKKKKPIKSNIKFYQGDCRKIIPKYKLFEKSDIAIFDPPYNLGYKYDIYKDRMPEDEYIKLLSTYRDFPTCVIQYAEQMPLLYEAFGCKPTKTIAWIYQTNLPKNFRLINFFNCEPNLSKVSQPYKSIYDKRIQNQIVNGKSKPIDDVWNIGIVKNMSREKTKHPCQIPVELCLRLLRISSEEGWTILDGFAGSGSMAVACKKSGRHFIGVEISKNYIDIAKKRVRKV